MGSVLHHLQVAQVPNAEPVSGADGGLAGLRTVSGVLSVIGIRAASHLGVELNRFAEGLRAVLLFL